MSECWKESDKVCRAKERKKEKEGTISQILKSFVFLVQCFYYPYLPIAFVALATLMYPPIFYGISAKCS